VSEHPPLGSKLVIATHNAGKLKDFRRAIAKVLTVINANKKKEKKAKPANKKSSRKN